MNLVVQDNGKGFPDNVDYRNTDSLGLQLGPGSVTPAERSCGIEVNGIQGFRCISLNRITSAVDSLSADPSGVDFADGVSTDIYLTFRDLW